MAHHPRDEKKGNARQIARYGIDDSLVVGGGYEKDLKWKEK